MSLFAVYLHEPICLENIIDAVLQLVWVGQVDAE